VDFAYGPIARQVVKRYGVRRNIIWNSVLYHSLRR
jgi:hypothetical protein